MRSIILAVVVVAMSGCTFLTPGGKDVVFTKNQERIAGCEFVGDVNINKILPGGAGALNQTIITAKNNTADLGGDTLFLAVYDPKGFGTTVTGEAYKCRR